jgi:hypothetical protein
MVQLTPLTKAPSDAPVLASHVTTAPPLPPVTVPESEIVAEVVVAGGGFTMSVSGPGPVVVKRVTLTVCETLAVASAAVTVMRFSPIASGILTMVQVTPLIDAPSDAAVLVTQVTAGAPLPPVTVPERVIIAKVVVAGGRLTTRTSGPPPVALRRVIFTVWETLPVASAAVTVMLFNPIARGILTMVQVTPLIEAPSDAAALVTHVTAGAPLPPVTVPERDIVANVVVAGVTLMVRTKGFGEVTTRVTLIVRETVPVASVAVTVMLFTPSASGTLRMVQLEPLIEAPSDAPVLVSHVTTAPPLPPVTVPESDIVAEVVVAGGRLTVRASGTVPVRAAYIVRMAALSPSARPVTILK